ncbi:MAG: tRNA lysidine(34) synthetase TilS [Planctomycetota bacterium]|nr:tRNA lysidine(34) synthetase TilS [Planctomycetota bacterium]
MNSEDKGLPARTALQQRIEAACARYDLLPSDGSPLVVAVSGGKDSVALAWGLNVLKKRIPLKLVLACMDHGIDSAFQKQAEQVVGKIGEICEAKVSYGRTDIPEIVKTSGENLEVVARKERYRFLEEVARSLGARKIALGHHGLDQAETVLFRLLRGTGPIGLRGMTHRSLLGGTEDIFLVRPLLSESPEDLQLLITESGIQPVEDPTNRDLGRARAFLRHEVLPKLEASPFFPATVRSIGKLTAQQDLLIRDLEERAEKLFHELLMSPGVSNPEPAPALYLDREKFHSVLPVMRVALLGKIFSQLELDTNIARTERIVREIFEVRGNPQKRRVDLPGPLVLEEQGNVSTFRVQRDSSPDQD